MIPGNLRVLTSVQKNLHLTSVLLPDSCQQPPEMGYYSKYLGNAKVREAIHVGNEPFKQGLEVEEALINDVMQSIAYNLSVIMDNYKVLLFNGNLDIIVGKYYFNASKKLNFSMYS